MPTQFSWIPFYRELTQRLLSYEDRQAELIALMEEMRAAGLPVVPLEDVQPDNHRLPLEVIDPFTFLANFARTYEESAFRLCRWIQQKWDLSVSLPTDFEGLALLNARNSWFFASRHGGRAGARRVDDIPLLWRLARAAFGSTVFDLDAALYSDCRSIPNCGLRKLTTGLFWISPNGFLPLGSNMLPFLKARGVTWDNRALESNDLAAYQKLVEAAHGINFNHAALVQESQAWAKAHPIQASQPIEALPEFPLNQILYGPPGTGKTYSTIARAVEIIDGSAPEERADCVARFEELRAAGQIAFITFHQSFAYEEFIEGLRPVVDESSQNGARYAVRDGVFKQMALRALGAMLERRSSVAQIPAGASCQATFNELWNELLKRIQSEERVVEGHNSVRYRLSLSQRGSIIGNGLNNLQQQRFIVSRDEVQSTWKNLESGALFSTAHIAAKPGDFTFLIVEELKRIKSEIEAYPAPNNETKFSLEETRDFLNGLPGYNLRTGQQERFVLIVDEINRGNISKIFGELITLLEPDKRLGAANALRVLLPYSGDTFALPPNLYLLGTMNTADKSLALLDVALRRRFSFQELNPDFTVCNLPDATMLQVLAALNQRIMLVLDREHRIGHAFFMGVQTIADFNAVFADKIVPLLQEYFYNDWDGLRSVLGEKENGAIVGKMVAIESVRGRNHYAWWSDLGKPAPDFFDVLRKNYGIAAPVASSAVTSTNTATPETVALGEGESVVADSSAPSDTP